MFASMSSQGGGGGGWVAYRPGGGSIVACSEDSQGQGSWLTSIAKDSAASTNGSQNTVVRTFPLLPSSASDGGGLFNGSGTLLAITCRDGLMIMRFPETLGQLTLVDDELSSDELIVAEDRQEGDQQRLRLKWVGPTWSSPTSTANWGLLGSVTNGSYHGEFTGDVNGTFSLRRILEAAREEWYGECILGETEWKMRLIIDRQSKRASLGRVGVEYVDPIVLQGRSVRDICWHPMSSHHLCVLDSTGQLRIYNCSGSVNIPEEPTVNLTTECIRISFLENNSTGSLWSRLACFGLCTDGSILVACPVGNLQALNVTEQELREERKRADYMSDAVGNDKRMRRQLQSYLDVALLEPDAAFDPADPIAVQIVCASPRSPRERYQGERGPPSLAVDFTLTRIDSSRRAAAIHRTWSCGRMDVVLWSDCEAIRPWWKQYTTVLGGGASASQAAIQDSPQRGASSETALSLNRLVHRTGVKLTMAIDTPPFIPDRTRIIRCMEMWKGDNCRPYLYPPKAFPLVFVCLDLANGNGLLFQSTWAKRPGAKDVIVDTMLLNTSEMRLNHRNACLVYSDLITAVQVAPNAMSGFGLLWLKGERGSKTVVSLDLSRYLRALNAPLSAVQRPQLMNAAAAPDEQLGASMDAQLEFARKLNATLAKFRDGIPPEIANIVVDRQPQDQETTVGILEWLNDYYTSLTSRKADEKAGRKSIVAWLEEAAEAMEKKKIEQRAFIEKLVVELRECEQDVLAMPRQHDAMLSLIEQKKEMADLLRLSARSALARAVHQRGSTNSDSERRIQERLRGLNDRAEDLIRNCQTVRRQKADLLRALKMQALQMDEHSDHEGERDYKEHYFDGVTELLQMDAMVQDMKRKVDAMFNSVDHLVLVLPRVFLVLDGDLRDVTEVQAEWEELQERGLPFRIQVHDKLMKSVRQMHYRLQNKIENLPLEVGIRDSLVKIIYLPRDSQIRKHGEHSFRLLEPPPVHEVCENDFIEVIPLVFVSAAGRRSFKDRVIGASASVGKASNPERFAEPVGRLVHGQDLVSCFQLGWRDEEDQGDADQ